MAPMQVVGLSAKTTNEIEATKDGRIVKLRSSLSKTRFLMRIIRVMTVC